MIFEITDVEPMDGKKNLKAFFSIAYGPVKITNWTYWQDQERSWVDSPQMGYKKDDNKYSNIEFFPERELFDAFQKWATGEIEAQLSADLSVKYR